MNLAVRGGIMRKPWVIGLIAGAIGALVNVVVSTLMGICGPFWSLGVGAIATALSEPCMLIRRV